MKKPNNKFSTRKIGSTPVIPNNIDMISESSSRPVSQKNNELLTVFENALKGIKKDYWKLGKGKDINLNKVI